MTGDILRSGGPAAVGLPDDLPALLQEAAQEGLTTTGIPGAAVLVARHGVVVYEGCHGWAQDHDERGQLSDPRPVTPDTIFDVASLTKVAATVPVVMWLVDRGVLDVDDLLERHLPRPGRLAGRGIRLRHLLEHRAGLPPWQPLYLWAADRDAAIARIAELDLGPVGTSREYSDLGMMLLGVVAERAGGAALDELLDRAVVAPLGLVDTGFRPDAGRRRRCAATSTGNPTEHRMIATDDPFPVDGLPTDFTGWRDRTIVGEVNDGNTRHAFAGVAGHAGLFSTARDLAVYGQTLLQHGAYGGTQVWRPATVTRFTGPGTEATQALGYWRRRLRALGADVLSDRSYGHRGFTGCELVVDPARQLVIVMLSNRLHTEADPPTDDTPLWRAVVRTVVRGCRRGPAGGHGGV